MNAPMASWVNPRPHDARRSMGRRNVGSGISVRSGARVDGGLDASRVLLRIDHAPFGHSGVCWSHGRSRHGDRD